MLATPVWCMCTRRCKQRLLSVRVLCRWASSDYREPAITAEYSATCPCTCQKPDAGTPAPPASGAVRGGPLQHSCSKYSSSWPQCSAPTLVPASPARPPLGTLLGCSSSGSLWHHLWRKTCAQQQFRGKVHAPLVMRLQPCMPDRSAAGCPMMSA